MTEDGQDGDGVPDSDPDHIDPAGDLADIVESGDIDIELSGNQDCEALQEFLRRAQAGMLDTETDPSLETAFRIVQAILDAEDGSEHD